MRARGRRPPFLVSGKPIREPIAWNGPIAMNTKAEFEQTFNELHAGTFIR